MEGIAQRANNELHGWQEVGRRLGVGRSKVFALWAGGELPSVKVGAKRMSTTRQLDDYITRLESGAA
ncbi:hypothetical protein MINS_03970 [Mycolicibacterium insubricum]|nr:hypothetical protein [Mycolicibacterium insubricum]MCV7082894.1 hypothetical protein [Mycolicibacterium insubricum]BBZ64968.1 hypothetical protein MINS_03970 [Mycolicibacterium insubricum]